MIDRRVFTVEKRQIATPECPVNLLVVEEVILGDWPSLV
jgi:hypothetical protein